jgi:hypothetical protein
MRAIESDLLLQGRADYPCVAAAHTVFVDGVHGAELLVIGDRLTSAASQQQGENNKGVFHGFSRWEAQLYAEAEQFGGFWQ